uniref:Uncharacterized protein n=1 Tax=Aegilops tauschii subsp. strangulata TaxID=200361 RepID=A0A453AMZ3_AEGTS
SLLPLPSPVYFAASIGGELRRCVSASNHRSMIRGSRGGGRKRFLESWASGKRPHEDQKPTPDW